MGGETQATLCTGTASGDVSRCSAVGRGGRWEGRGEGDERRE